MLRLHLPRGPYDLFIYDFFRFFRHRRLIAGYGVCLHFIWPSCDFFDGVLQQTGAKPCTDRAEIVRRRPCGLRAVSAAMHRNHMDIARRPRGFRTEAVRTSYGGCVILVYFGAFVYQT